MDRPVSVLIILVICGCQGKKDPAHDPNNVPNPEFITPQQAAKLHKPDAKYDPYVKWAKDHGITVKRNQGLPGWPVTNFGVYESNLTAEEFVQWVRLHPEPQIIERFSIGRTEIGDDALLALKHLTGLRTVHLSVCPVTDEGLAQLSHTPSVTDLELSHIPTIKGPGLKHLPPGLTRLSINALGLNDQSMKHLPDLPVLKELVLVNSRIGDDGMAVLQKLQALETVSLMSTRITDETAIILSKLPKLQTLTITGTVISNEGLKLLAESRSLKWLQVRNTQINAEGIEAFRALRPQCQVTGP